MVSQPYSAADCVFRGLRDRLRSAQRAAFRILQLLAVWIGCVGPLSTAVSATPPTDYQIKAVFLYNFTRFIEWPATAFAHPEADFVICVLGEDPFGADLDRVIRGEARNGHPVTVERYDSIDDIGTCHILFISAKERPKLPTIQRKLSGSSTLTVTDGVGLENKGVMINLTTAANRVKVDINLEAANAAGLTLSSKLLRAANVVDARTVP